MGSLIAAALARAQGFLLEPAVALEPQPLPAAVPAPIEAHGPVHVVVTGLSRGSGATTIASGLTQALVVPGARSAHLVSLRRHAAGGRRGPRGVVAWELPPALWNADEVADYGATLARLAAGGGRAAVVWDVRADDAARAARVMEECDAVVCVADGSAEPALCTLVCDMLAERYGRVLLVANRVRDEESWSGRCAVAVPESRLAAMLIGRGRAVGGVVAAAMSRIGALAEEQT
jgi:hypothetical protein